MGMGNLKAWILLICGRQVLKFKKIEKLPGSLIGFKTIEPTCTLVDMFS